MDRRRVFVWAYLFGGPWLTGCGDGSTMTPAPEGLGGGGGSSPGGCPPGAFAHPGAGCCPAGTFPLDDGSCVPAGVPPERCAAGFEPDGAQGCEPVLPVEPCFPGTMAVPGDDGCRALADCGDPPWGDIPIDGATQFVDGAYAGGDSDGSATRPWTSIQAAIDAAVPDAVVAIAAGSYSEMVDTDGKAVKLWGRCPELVEINPPAGSLVAVEISPGSDQAELHRVAIVGDAHGLAVWGAQSVWIEQVWIHDTTGRGVVVQQDDDGQTDVTLHRVLVERATEIGVFVGASRLVIEQSAIRETLAPPVGLVSGVGVLGQSRPTTRAVVELRDSVVERNRTAAVVSTGADLLVHGSVIRDTDIHPVDEQWGRGISLQAGQGHRAAGILRASLVAHNHEFGVFVEGSDALLDAMVVRDTEATPAAGLNGDGLAAQPGSAGQRSAVAVRRSLFERNTENGVILVGVQGAVDQVAVRDTRPRIGDGTFGRGIELEDTFGMAGDVAVRHSSVTGGYEVGLAVIGVRGEVETTVIRDVQARMVDGGRGRCVMVQINPQTLVPANATFRTVLVERCFEAGIMILESNAALERIVAREILPAISDDEYGDGVVVHSSPEAVTIADAHIEGAERAGLSAFGSEVLLSGSTLECNTIHLDAEQGAHFENRGGNRCGCGPEQIECTVASSNLAPPPPL